MVLGKLDNTLLTLRICSIGSCFMALLLYLGNGHVVLDTMTRFSLVALIVQLIWTSTELVAPLCFGVANPLPNHLGWSLLIILIDYLCASFVLGSGFGEIGIFIYKTEIHAWLRDCKISLLHAILVFVGGVLSGFAAICITAIGAKMNIQRQAQD